MVYAVSPVLALAIIAVEMYSGKIHAVPVLYSLLTVFLIVYSATAPRRIFNKTRGKNPTITSTAFFEDYFAFSAVNQNSTRNGSFRYESVAKAYETATAFYLQQSTKTEWYFLPKKFFAPGQAEALRDLFARKFGERFKSKV